jgi:hypothetical protein
MDYIHLPPTPLSPLLTKPKSAVTISYIVRMGALASALCSFHLSLIEDFGSGHSYVAMIERVSCCQLHGPVVYRALLLAMHFTQQNLQLTIVTSSSYLDLIERFSTCLEDPFQ